MWPTMQYYAGFFDGEGCIRWDGSTIRVAITNTYPQVLRLFAADFGGKVVLRKEANSKNRPSYVWSLAGQQACEFLEEIYAHLREKGPQAALAFEILNSLPHTERRRKLVSRLKKLKKVAHASSVD